MSDTFQSLADRAACQRQVIRKSQFSKIIFSGGSQDTSHRNLSKYKKKIDPDLKKTKTDRAVIIIC
ncbi:hypothetical protein L1994_08300 [Methanomicrobium antiquum]|uniref:Uncharacterized protein n=1 Tax=Methanomicrobium antiquum TaxID=487686 RepID=A0AAF0JL13_9EURY|nr:hypothetical protein [Methanomicrobium antiquum]MDD3976789.1 hypothetical protein [Methanomicrobium sp.]WFN36144.1 hypothetical protein L1994_08300 [Methanomicrobium antiquum]